MANECLYSLNQSFCWEGPVVHAHKEPTRENQNGIYAVCTLDEAPAAEVWGEVALSGVVVVGEHGYRAAVAAIRSLYVGEEWRVLPADGVRGPQTLEQFPNDALVRALEARYHVEVRRAPSRVQAMQAVIAANNYAAQQYALQAQLYGTFQSSMSTQMMRVGW